MGQYYIVANLDKKEILRPHRFGDGAKLVEIGGSGGGTMMGLALLLATSNGRGGGDIAPQGDYDWKTNKGDARYEKGRKRIEAVAGRWAGDRIAMVGDYADPENPKEFSEAYESKAYIDISKIVIEALMEDSYLKRGFEENPCFKTMNGIMDKP